MLIAMFQLQAQTYQIDFKGSGMSTVVNSVKVWNLTTDTSFTISGADTLLLANASGINKNDREDNLLVVFPNPAEGFGKISFQNNENGRVLTEIFDLSGKMIIRTDDILPRGLHTYGIGGMKTGLYWVRVHASGKNYARKWVSISEGTGDPYVRYEGVKNSSFTNARLNGSKGSVAVTYNPGDIMMFKGISGNYSKIITLVPTSSQTVDFEFITCKDGSNNNYSVVTIGPLTWMAENLRTSKYNDGTNIPKISDATNWSITTTPAMCWYDNDSANNGPKYGVLYKWYVVSQGTLCPTGWHVPTVTEWNVLATFLGGDTLAGGKMKEPGTQHWDSTYTGTTNSSGFTALPAGMRLISNGAFSDVGLHTYYWTATDYSTNNAHIRSLSYNSNKLNAGGNNKGNGFSVRCVKD